MATIRVGNTYICNLSHEFIGAPERVRTKDYNLNINFKIGFDSLIFEKGRFEKHKCKYVDEYREFSHGLLCLDLDAQTKGIVRIFSLSIEGFFTSILNASSVSYVESYVGKCKKS